LEAAVAARKLPPSLSPTKGQEPQSEPAIYTKKQTRKLVHAAFKAGLINLFHARPSNDLSGQNSRLNALKRLFPKIFTEGQPGHVTRKQEQAARAVAKQLEGLGSRYVN
jgi:hypothetical protein